MQVTIINPKVDDYIKDLLTDNKRSFGLIAHYKTVIKLTKDNLHKRVTWAVSEKDRAKCYEYVNTILRYYDLIRFECEHIKLNFNKIRGLKNGTIKEI